MSDHLKGLSTLGANADNIAAIERTLNLRVLTQCQETMTKAPDDVGAVAGELSMQHGFDTVKDEIKLELRSSR